MAVKGNRAYVKSVDPPFVLIDQAAKEKKCLTITEISGKRKENEYSGWMGMYEK